MSEESMILQQGQAAHLFRQQLNMRCWYLIVGSQVHVFRALNWLQQVFH